MTNLVRVILTFQNPTKLEMRSLTGLLFQGKSIIDQPFYIASPHTNFIHYSNDRLENIDLANALSINELTPEFIAKFQKDYKKKKSYLENYNNQLLNK